MECKYTEIIRNLSGFYYLCMNNHRTMNVAIIGYGKMGRMIEKILQERGHAIGMVVDVDNACYFTPESLQGIDVAIEFSAPEAAFGNVCTCIEARVPVVCGTTAWLDRYAEAEALCRERGGAFFYASNYSIGVNLTFRLNRILARMMNPFGQYDVTIEEVHHTQKKDAPSGTAITMAEGVLEGLDRKTEWVGRTTTEPGELEVVAIRRSVVPGTHTVTYESDCDYISLTHSAKSREGFARGAVAAAEFICGKKGIFTMDDMLA